MSIILVDVDLTVVDTATPWRNWMITRSSSPLRLGDAYKQLPYDLTKIFSPDSFPNVDPYDYWRQESLYDDLLPLEGSVEVLEELSYDHEIVFVSALKGNHHKSKYNFLKKHFPFLSGFIGTKEKGYVRGSIIIDDRNSYLNQFDPVYTKRIKKETIFTQDEILSGTLPDSFYDWKDFKSNTKGVFEC